MRAGGCTVVHLLALVSLLALSFQLGEAVRCYVCASSRDPGCKDPFNKDHNYHKLTECTQDSMRNIHDLIPDIYSHFGHFIPQHEEFACVKAVTREHDREEVVRSCTIPKADTFDVCSQLKSRHLVFCQACKGDSCNSAETAAPMSLLLMLLPASVVGLRLFTQNSA